jgi:hypothetical protein
VLFRLFLIILHLISCLVEVKCVSFMGFGPFFYQKKKKKVKLLLRLELDNNFHIKAINNFNIKLTN